LSLPDTQAEQDRRLRLDLKRRLRLAGFDFDLSAIGDITVLRQLLDKAIEYSLDQPVEVEIPHGPQGVSAWLRGTFVGYERSDSEDFRRLSVRRGAGGSMQNLPPEMVRPVATPKPGGIDPNGAASDSQERALRTVCGESRTMHRWAGVGEPCLDCGEGSWTTKPCPALTGPSPQEPAPGSSEAVTQAALRHTPGPWKVEDPMGPETLSVVVGENAADWKFIAQIHASGEDNDPAPAEGAANAALIARAWEMPELERQSRKLTADLETSRLLCGRLADALEAYLEHWEQDAQITFNEGDDHYFAAVSRQGPHDNVPTTFYVSRDRWERREKARETLAAAGRRP
jgi:hypothetical protein